MKNIESVNKIVADTFKISITEVNEGLTPEDLSEWDSLGQMNLIQAIEEDLDIELEIDEIFSIYCIGDLYKVLIERSLIEGVKRS